MRSVSKRRAAAWCSCSSPAEPARADAALVGGALVAWGLATCGLYGAETRPAFVLAAFATAAFVGALYRRDRLRAGHVLLLGLGLRALVAGLPPLLSDDVYRYVWDGLVQRAGTNPYAFPPAALADTVGAPGVLSLLNSPDYYSVYPPASQLVFRVAGDAYAAGGLERAYGLLKVLFAAADVAVLVLLIRVVPPRRALLWAAAPLVVLDGSGQVHTEALCALALVGAALAERRGLRVLVGVLLAVAGWVKLVPWLLLPVWLLRRDRRVVAGAVAVGAFLALPYAAPYVVGHVGHSLDLYVRLFEFNAGPYYALKEGLGGLTGLDLGKQIGPALRLVFFAGVLVTWKQAERARWCLAPLGVRIYGLFLATATTVHPWYLLPLLALLPLAGRAGWAWHALGLGSLGTYWFYTGGAYVPFVVAGWMAWAFLLLVPARKRLLAALMRWRARAKVARLAPALPPLPGLRVLDLGAGEGYVGEVLARAGARVVVADVVPSARVSLPAVHAGGRLPFAPDAFDVVLLVFVLHHARDAGAVIGEALRVGKRVVVLESVYETRGERALLERLDRLANGLRGPWMRDPDAPLGFREASGWRALLGERGQVVLDRGLGRPPHRQHLFVIEPLL